MSARITVNQRLIYSGRDRLKLVCAVRLWEAPNGDLLSTWLSGSDNEPASDNCAVMSRSSDGGNTWSDPEMLVAAGEMAGAAGPMLIGKRGQLIAFGGYWPYDKHYTERYWFRMESNDSGHTWGERQPLTVHNNYGGFGEPIQLANGELLFPGAFHDPRPVPLVAPIKQLCEATSEEEALAMPAVPGESSGRKFATHLHGCCVYISPDEEATSLQEYGYIANRPLGLLEPVCVQLRDGRIVMLMRAEWGGYLWRAESADNGRTWTPAWETDIPNPSSHTSLIRLPDGRIALIHNPTGQKGVFGLRNPLSIWISDDEMASWSIREDVIASSGNYRPDNWPAGPNRLAYPHAKILDGKLVFVYDRNRRDAVFVEVEIR
ncbi:MAG: exo-alpha-sialidase [Chloroflexi bacterium]|nr:exo-alpha-sialidase [Chloroflexota bacterium]